MKGLYNRLFIYFSILIIVMISILLVGKFNIGKINKTKYILNNNIGYVIKQKDGNISNSKLYVSSLVDNIDVRYNSKYSLDDKKEFEYRYEIITYVIANVDDNTLEETEVYRKEKVLKKTNILSSNLNSAEINDTVTLDYDYYNGIATEYDNSVNIAIKSKLLVEFNLYIILDNNDEQKYTSTVSLQLGKPTFSITKNEVNTKGDIAEEKGSNSTIFLTLYSVVLIIVILIIIEIIRIKNYKKAHMIEFKYRKIMKDYDSIVVPINQIPKSSSIVMVKVLYFKSMIDIQKELHIPILCYYGENDIIYIIMNDKLGYVYFLNNTDEKI